jgi:hypothetical protein
MTSCQPRLRLHGKKHSLAWDELQGITLGLIILQPESLGTTFMESYARYRGRCSLNKPVWVGKGGLVCFPIQTVPGRLTMDAGTLLIALGFRLGS